MGKENVKQSGNVPSADKEKKVKAAKKGGEKTAKGGNAGTKDDKKKKEASAQKKKEAEETTHKEDEATTEKQPPNLAELVAALRVSEKLTKAMEELREPREKSRLQDDAKELAWRLKSQMEGYKFEARGTLFSESLEHVSAAECHLVKDSKGPIPPEDAAELYNLARQEMEYVFGVCVTWTTADGKSHEAWGQQHLKKADIHGVQVSGARKVPGGWMLPTTLELGVAHSKRADSVKIPDIADALDRGDFAQVVVMLLEFFKHKKRLREALVEADNAYLGRLRFFATQLQMLDDLGPKSKDKALEYVRNAIGGLNLEWYDNDPSTKKTNDALQARAKVILTTLYPTFGPHIKPTSQRELFAAAYDRTLGR